MANLPAPAITVTSDVIDAKWFWALGVWLSKLLREDASLEYFIHKVDRSWYYQEVSRKAEFTLSAEDATALFAVISPIGGALVFTEPRVTTLQYLAQLARTTVQIRWHDALVRRANAGLWLSEDEIAYLIDLGPWGCV